MQVFNRNVSVRGLTVFGFEIVLISGSMALAASLHGGFSGTDPGAMLSKIAIVTALCELCFYYNDLYDLTIVHSNRELVVRLLQARGRGDDRARGRLPRLPDLLLDPQHLRHRARRVRGRGADLADGVQPSRARSAPRGTAADRRDRTDRAQAGATDRAAAGLRLPDRRLHRRDRRRGRWSASTTSSAPPSDIDRIVARPPRRPHRRRAVGPPRPAADRAAAPRQDVGRPRRGRDDDLRTADRQDPARRSQTELADLLATASARRG